MWLAVLLIIGIAAPAGLAAAPARSAGQPEVFAFTSLLKVAGYTLGANYFVVLNDHPDIIVSETQFPYPIQSFAGETLPPRALTATVQRRGFEPPDAPPRPPAYGPTRHALHLPRGGPADIALEFTFTGEQALYRIEAGVLQRGIDCNAVLSSMIAEMGRPDARLITSAIWRLVDIDQEEVLDVQCEPGRGYQAVLTNQSIRQAFEADVEQRFLRLWQRYRRVRRR